jgi:hypothetical protein
MILIEMKITRLLEPRLLFKLYFIKKILFFIKKIFFFQNTLEALKKKTNNLLLLE